MAEDEFTKLFNYMEKRFNNIEAKLEGKADGNRLYSSLNAIMKRLDTDIVERGAMNNQLNRHERWIQHLAAKVGTKLS
jgi:hypothetical protein